MIKVSSALSLGLVLGVLPLLQCGLFQFSDNSLSLNTSGSGDGISTGSGQARFPSPSFGGRAPTPAAAPASRLTGPAYYEERNAWTESSARLVSTSPMELQGDLVFKIVPMPRAVKYACVVTQELPGKSKVEWSSMCGSGPDCFAKATTPECRIPEGEAQFRPGPIRVMAYAGRIYRKSWDFPEEDEYWTSWREDREAKIMLVNPRSSLPPTPWDAEYQPTLTGCSDDSPFGLTESETDASIRVEGGKFKLMMLARKHDGGKTEQHERSPGSYVRLVSTIEADGKVGPVTIPLTTNNLAVFKSLGWRDLTGIALHGWFKNANSKKQGKGRVGRLWLEAVHGKSVGKDGCTLFSIRSPEYSPGQEDKDKYNQMYSPSEGGGQFECSRQCDRDYRQCAHACGNHNQGCMFRCSDERTACKKGC